MVHELAYCFTDSLAVTLYLTLPFSVFLLMRERAVRTYYFLSHIIDKEKLYHIVSMHVLF